MAFKEDAVWKESFFTDNFSVDQCLSKYTQKSDLESLRRELKHYGNELQTQMSDILKTETEAIVNLAEYLTNLNSKIEDLNLPICQLQEEIRTLYDLIKNAQISYNSTLDHLKQNHNQCNHIHLKLGIISSSLYIEKLMQSDDAESFDNIIVLERFIHKYSFHRTYLDELGIMTPDIENTVQHFEKKLINKLNDEFLKSVKNDNREVIAKCLRMYDNLGKQNVAQSTHQTKIVRTALDPLFSERNLLKLNHDVSKLYEQLMQFLNNNMSVLLEVLESNSDLKNYNFILHSFWAEFDKQSREKLPYITAPGNPELFQKRFTCTFNLLTEIAARCGDNRLVYTNETFQEHIKRFNLPVYFEIRFQQIAGGFESTIYTKSDEYYCDANNDLNCKLKVTLALWAGLKECFQADIFIDQLTDQFVKLSFLLISRFVNWFGSVLNETIAKPEEFIIHSLQDINIIKRFVCVEVHQINESIYKIIPPKIQPVLSRLFQCNAKTLEDVSTKLQNYLIQLQIKDCLSVLQNVREIPRLYRRTNRGAPKEQSSYMTKALLPILALHQQFHGVIGEDLQFILDKAITEITLKYLALVQEVLRSVCKTEESLRRLKNRNVGANEDSAPSDTTSDEMKIREQIKFDVAYFLDKLYVLGSDSSKQQMDKLKEEVK